MCGDVEENAVSRIPIPNIYDNYKFGDVGENGASRIPIVPI